MHQVVGCRGRELLTGDKLAEVDGVILGEQLNHVPAGAKDQFTDGSPIRLWLREQAFGFLGMRTELLANKIGNPLGAGEVQIFFRTEVVGDGSDILPGLGGYLAGGGVHSIFTKLCQCRSNQLFFRLFTLDCHGRIIHRTVHS